MERRPAITPSWPAYEEASGSAVGHCAHSQSHLEVVDVGTDNSARRSSIAEKS